MENDQLGFMSEGSGSSAVFSYCRQYRYELWRRWGPGPYAMFIGLNPSTATETLDDPTIRRCIAYSKAWGFDAYCMTNIFAFRATDPKVMKSQKEPIGLSNDETLIRLAKDAGVVVAAWGTHGIHMGRHQQVVDMIPNLMCLAKTKDGYPGHPLYLKKDLKPVPWNGND